MVVKLDTLDERRLNALEIRAHKRKVAGIYDKKVWPESFIEGELIWKIILPLGYKEQKFGKWSSSWE